MIRRLSIPIQTTFVDLVERAWRGNVENLTARTGGSAYRQERDGRRYWYWQPPTVRGKQPSSRYIGPDTPETSLRINELAVRSDGRRERRDMVRALRAAGLPTPERLTGEILAALAEAGAFRLRATLIGSVAFQCYAGILGARLDASLARTSDVDLAQFHAVSIAVDDRMDRSFGEVLKAVDPGFTEILDPFDSRRVMRYALMKGGEEVYAVDLLSPLRGPDRGRLTYLRALGSHAQLLRFLDFLLYHDQESVVLYGAGIPVRIPAPERYALHKLIIAQERRKDPRSQLKAVKDRDQAAALITILLEDRPDDLIDVWRDLVDRGASWRARSERGIALLPEPLLGRFLREAAR